MRKFRIDPGIFFYSQQRRRRKFDLASDYCVKAKAWSAQFAYTQLAIQLEEVIDQNGCRARRYIDRCKADCPGPGCKVSGD